MRSLVDTNFRVLYFGGLNSMSALDENNKFNLYHLKFYLAWCKFK